MAFDDRTCWLMSAGPRGRHATAFVDLSLVSLAWDWPALGDLATVADAEIFLTLEASGHRKPADDLRDLRMFSGRMADGDLVVVPDQGAGDLLFGEITGAYAYQQGGREHRHTRPIRWFGRLRTGDAPELLLAHTTSRQMIRRLPEQLHWQRLATEVEDFLGRDVRDVRRAPARVVGRDGGRTSGTSAGRARSGAHAKPKPAAVPDRLCPSCGLLRAPSLYDDGEEFCRDCA